MVVQTVQLLSRISIAIMMGMFSLLACNSDYKKGQTAERTEVQLIDSITFTIPMKCDVTRGFSNDSISVNCDCGLEFIGSSGSASKEIFEEIVKSRDYHILVHDTIHNSRCVVFRDLLGQTQFLIQEIDLGNSVFSDEEYSFFGTLKADDEKCHEMFVEGFRSMF